MGTSELDTAVASESGYWLWSSRIVRQSHFATCRLRQRIASCEILPSAIFSWRLAYPPLLGVLASAIATMCGWRS